MLVNFHREDANSQLLNDKKIIRAVRHSPINDEDDDEGKNHHDIIIKM